jgi:type IV pilus assembly protein PilO
MKLPFGKSSNHTTQAGMRKWMYIVALVGVPLASFFLVFQPQNREIERAKTEIQLKRTMLDKVREETARSADLKRSNEKIGEAIKSIEARLPSDKEMDLVLRDVAEIASRCGLKLPIFKRGEKPLPAGQALEQPLEVQITGDFDGFYKFLLELENLPRIVRIPDLKLSRADEGDGHMQADLTLSVYYLGGSEGGAK